MDKIEDTRIKNFTDLHVWQKGHELLLKTYQLTDAFPQKEIFGLASQMQRCAVSITSNIAEGFSRKGYKEKIQFFYTSLGSTTELQNQLLIARDLKYISSAEYNDTIERLLSVQKLLNGLIKKTKTFLNLRS